MATPELNDAELDALMAELEEVNASITATEKPKQTASVVIAQDEKPIEKPDVVDDKADATTTSAAEPEVAPRTFKFTGGALKDASGNEGEERTIPLEKHTDGSLTVGDGTSTVVVNVGDEVADPHIKAVARKVVEKVKRMVEEKPTEPVFTTEEEVEQAALVRHHAPAVQPEHARPATKPEPKSQALSYYIDVGKFREDTSVTEATLDKCMIEQNGLRAYYGAQAANAEAQASRMKARFEVVEATLYDHHRKELALTGEKTTEKMVENAVKMDPRWLKARNLVIEAETIASINKGLVESIKDRRDMIIQLGADRRDEYKGAARVLAEQNERESIRDRAMAAMKGARAA